MKELRNTTLAYLAGFIDGEGYIGIRKGKRKGCVNLVYWCEMRAVNTRIAPLELLRATFDGMIYLRRGRKHNWKDQWHWVAPLSTIQTILTALLPYLIIKKEDAELLLRFYRDRTLTQDRSLPTPPEEVALREAFYQESRRLKDRCGGQRDDQGNPVGYQSARNRAVHDWTQVS